MSLLMLKSGVSGAGKSPSAITHYSDMNENFKIYKVNQHQHIPEVEQQLRRWLQVLSLLRLIRILSQ